MKKLIFYSILILFFLASCTPDYEEATYTQPAALPDPAPVQTTGNVTVYLDGYEPPESRAMNKEFAMMGCDYFEVVFVGKDNSGNVTIARGQWRIGEKAGVFGVYRTTGGVNYGSVLPSASLGNNAGSAILLAGKSDKTIMAIGKLSSATSLITTSTTSVTFDVAAIQTGVKGEDSISSSSFLTAAKSGSPGILANVTSGNTEVTSVEMMGEYFIAFKLEREVPAIKAKYIFNLHSGSFSTYTAGLLVAKAGTVEKKYPSYTLPEGGNINVNSIIILDERTDVVMNNNQTVNAAFNPEVEFTFNTNVTNAVTISGSIFALVFEIPVYALVPECGWYIRPGYGALHYELDNGYGGMGGAVLIKTGEIAPPTVSTNFIIRIKTVPQKWRYRWSPATPPPAASSRPSTPDNEITSGTPHPVEEYDRTFRYTGLQVELREALPPNNLITTHPLAPAGIINNTALQFYIGKARVVDGYVLPGEFYGLVEVVVKFTEPNSGVSQETKFYILASGNHVNTYYFDYANPVDLNDRVFDLTTANYSTRFNEIENTGKRKVTILRLVGNVDISPQDIQLGNNTWAVLIMFVAGNQNLTLGRGGTAPAGNQIKFASDGSGLAALYFGKWPFAGLTRSPTALATTYPFSVNAGGTSGGSTSTPIYNNKMITDQAVTNPGGGIYNVDLDEPDGVYIHFRDLLH